MSSTTSTPARLRPRLLAVMAGALLLSACGARRSGWGRPGTRHGGTHRSIRVGQPVRE